MVLEAGHIIEFDTPLRLYEKTNGAFRKLIDEAGLDFIKFSRVKGWVELAREEESVIW